MKDALDYILIGALLVGTVFLFAGTVLYSRGRPWQTKEGFALFVVLGFFTLTKIAALLLLLGDFFTRGLFVILCASVAINGPLVFFFIRNTQRRRSANVHEEVLEGDR